MATSYSNPGGTGNRTASITVTSTATYGGGTPTNLVNGTTGNNTTASCWFNNGQSSKSITFDFGVGVSKIIDEAKWFQNGINPGHGNWKWQGSNDNSSYTDLSANFNLDAGSTGAVIGDLSANTTGYRYYRMAQQSGTTSDTPWLYEIEFKIDAAASELDLDATTHSLGVTVAATLTREMDLSASAAIGLSEAASFNSETNLPAAPALGLSMAAALVVEEDIPVSDGLGITMTVVLTRVSAFHQPVIVILT